MDEQGAPRERHGPDEIVRVWLSDPERWWTKDPGFDARLRERFGADVEAALRGDLDDWAETPRGALALVILLDQWTRNIHRDTPAMFAGDAKALGVCQRALARGDDAELTAAERQFLYMPLMHSEDPAHQRESVARFRALGQSVDFAERHAEIVFRFGRFPHRNRILGRTSTPEEEAFLALPGSSF